ncbi:MAG TPA: hypothetical protein VK615_00865 [Candidatus Binatia bacterium]|nr:hypothetical protein [Candidatus Binatia bacterium]
MFAYFLKLVTGDVNLIGGYDFDDIGQINWRLFFGNYYDVKIVCRSPVSRSHDGMPANDQKWQVSVAANVLENLDNVHF